MNKNLFATLIIISAVILGSAIVLTKYKDQILPKKETTQEAAKPEEYKIRAISEKDHILGNPDSKVILVEYSDLSCDYCKQFHTTLSTLMKKYGKDGNLAWVYRHFPRDTESTESYQASVASECVEKIAGKAVFWDFISLVFANSPNSLKADSLEKIVTSLGIPVDQYKSCILENPGKDKIQEDVNDGLKLFENDPSFGTPYNILITPNGLIKISGSQPLEILDELIKKNI